ncbi:MAG: glucose-1-phosphate adenylyltransferase subunit GlgD [Ruminococcaceae bacterium]|nr:glucose-1-phosphate adenylyltransferase subunit GlgD [Oscillospiraceae bacterium]
MAVAGLIFSNIHDSSIPEFTTMRTMASIPFGCRYRLVDFPLSNMVNSGITKIGIITHNNYQSLMDHIGTGKDWDLARRSGGIKILPPFITAYDNSGSKLYTTRLEALMGVTNFISRCNEDYIVLSDCDGICNIDLSDVIAAHIDNNADITIVTRCLGDADFGIKDATAIKADDNGAVTEASAYIDGVSGEEVSTNIMVVNRMFLLAAIRDAAAHGYRHFFKDIVARRLGRARIFRYLYEGTFIHIASLESYFASSMKLLEADVRNDLFNVPNRPVYTKLRNSPPTRYASGAKVINSYVADGCVIEGTVENSILFRGVKVGKGTVVKNCVLLQDTFTGNNVALNCVITDKNAVICDGRTLSGHSSMPFFIPKGAMV